MSTPNGHQRRLRSLHEQMQALRTEMTGLMKQDPVDVDDFELTGAQGGVRLSALFGTQRDLIVIHNMGRKCVYCTMWADGFNGLYPHIADRAAFVVTSPDTPAVQAEFAASRGWRFPMVSHHGTSFAAGMGYQADDGSFHPGLSTFRLTDDNQIVRVSTTPMGPGDLFNPAWHMFDLLADGANDWQPKYRYG